MFVNSNSSQGKPRPKHAIANTMHSDPNFSWSSDAYGNHRNTSFADTDDGHTSAEGSPLRMSPWNNVSLFQKPNWAGASPVPSFAVANDDHGVLGNALIGSLVREEGHVYSLATKAGDLLYTGSDSKNIHVWKNLKGFACFKSASGLVKAIVIAGDKILTGHQDGKIRVWKVSSKDPSVHKRYGSLPTLKDLFASSMRPSHYIEGKRRRSVWIKHSDAVSCLSLVEDEGLLYSASWDRTVKVWRISSSKCVESIAAHDDAVNSVVTSTDAMVFTGSADGVVKVWRRELQGKATKHLFMQTLLKQECAVTALAVDPMGSMVYCGSSDGLLNFWDRGNSLAHGGVLRGHNLAVLCVVARGRLVFSGSADKNICVWRRDGVEHQHLTVLSGHTGPVKCLAVEEDTEKGMWKLYSGSLDKSVKVWRVADNADGMQVTEAAGSAAESLRSNRILH